jgi:hypothetical protein
MVPMSVVVTFASLKIKSKGNGLMPFAAARVKGGTVTDILTNDEISLLRSLEKKSRTITGKLTHKRYDRLEAKGYIKRSSQSPSTQDMLYEITDAGKAALRAVGGAAG